MAHVRLSGANKQRLSLWLTKHIDDAIHFLWVANLWVDSRDDAETFLVSNVRQVCDDDFIHFQILKKQHVFMNVCYKLFKLDRCMHWPLFLCHGLQHIQPALALYLPPGRENQPASAASHLKETLHLRDQWKSGKSVWGQVSYAIS